jgi:peptidyl-Lys metalloendopeptidase
MSRRTGWISLIAGAAAFLAVASTATAGMAGLTTTIEAQKSSLGAADDAVVRITYRNDSQADLYLVRWQTALQGVEGNLFDVQLDGKPVQYTGRLYKRALPRAEDYVRIPAGGAVAADVELSSVYDLSRTGEYAIRYRVALQDALRADSAKSIAALGGRTLESNVVFLGVERDERGVAAVETLALLEEIGRPGLPGKALAPSYVSCSSSRQSLLVTALNNAQGLAQRSRDYLNAVPTASRSTDTNYKTWFGTYTSSRWSGVTSDYSNIYSAMSTKAFVFYCDCTDSSYAFVYANQPYKVHLCGAFWSAPATGTDSKAGTLIHETSHFTVVAGTQDYQYGQTACRSLAISNPTQAVHNADSHEYFAEPR